MGDPVLLFYGGFKPIPDDFSHTDIFCILLLGNDYCSTCMLLGDQATSPKLVRWSVAGVLVFP